MKRAKQIIYAGITLAALVVATALPLQSAGAIDVFSGSCANTTGGTSAGTPSGTPAAPGTPGSPGPGNAGAGGQSSSLCGASKTDDLNEIVKNVINTLLVILGMIAVIMIIIGGIRYTTSNGDSSQTKAAKDTILYSVVGLIVAILAFAIVNFIVDAFL